VLGEGERIVRGKTSFAVPVTLRKGARGPATLVARGIDSTGRVKTARRAVIVAP
jgi:hypothetical protein